MKIVDYGNVNITGGFWKSKEELNRKITIEAVWNRFSDTGRIKAFDCNWKEGDPDRPHIFWDSDVAKWMEAASYIIGRERNQMLEERIEGIIDCIEKKRLPDGYFNSYYITCDVSNRFTVRANHELYCAGHLFEAAVAYYKATGKDRFLKLMEDYADCIYNYFVLGDSPAFTTPGHEEIELALIKMYRVTGNKKLLSLAGFFLEKRGNNENDIGKEPGNRHPTYTQSHLPIREQKTAEGHAVRAAYLYSAMADYAYETGDEKLLEACREVFNDIANRKMYITGGIGSTSEGEAFTFPYDLPNDTAYAETCASIALAFFANRMLLNENKAVYADVVERALYNGMLSGLSIDGKRFFYENPLEINLSKHRLENGRRFPITQRPEIFGCSCCPPNVNRVLASLGGYAYGVEGKNLYVNQFMESSMSFEGISAVQTTAYPNDGGAKLTVKNAEYVMVRIPSWVKKFTVSKPYEMCDGYAKVAVNPCGDSVCVNFELVPTLVKANPLVKNNVGRVALTYGPVVYCLEGVDNPCDLNTLYISRELSGVKITLDDSFGLCTITADGYAESMNDRLYEAIDDVPSAPVRLKFIPYSCFANRGESDMTVFVNIK